jgi:hypothetical protein
MTLLKARETDTSALAVLCELREGRAVDELSAAIRTAVAHVAANGKSADVLVRITVAMGKKFGRLDVRDDISVKLSKPERPWSVFFPDEKYNLSRNEPNQDEFPLTTQPSTPSNPAKDINV